MKFICNVATEILPCCGLSARLKDVYVHVYDIILLRLNPGTLFRSKSKTMIHFLSF